jgi:iron complex transport system substrate-binding protein
LKRYASAMKGLLCRLVCALAFGHLAAVAAPPPTVPTTAPTAPLQVSTAPANPAGLANSAKAPQRIISLVPSLTEAVCLLQACERLVAVDRHSNWPEAVRHLPTLGGLDDTPLERLVALKPDLVLVPPSSRLIPRLNDLGIATLALPTQSHADVQAALMAVGARLARSDLAAALWADAQEQIQQAAQAIATPLRGRRVYVEVSSEPHAAGPASFIGQTLQRLGLRNITPESAGPFPRLNPEFIVRAEPDVVVAPKAGFERMRSRPGWAAMRALADPACALPPERWELLVRPGPRLGQAAQVLAACLNRTQQARQ